MEGWPEPALSRPDPDGLRGSLVESVPIAVLRSADSPRLQREDPDHIRTLAQSEADLPPIVVDRATMRVVDGMHRVHAAVQRGADRIDIRYVDGDESELFLLAVQLNTAHGLPLSLADRRAATARILRSHPQWSDRAIAGTTGLAAKAVAALRAETTGEVPGVHSRIGRDGRRRPLSTAEGRRSAGELVRANPQAPLRQIAREAGISLGTASDVRARVLRGEDPVPPQRPRSVPEQRGPEDTANVVRHGSRYGAPAAPPVQRDVAAILRILMADPSLRFTESGRQVLRWLGGHAIEPEEWTTLVEHVPNHAVGTVADLAQRCSEAWREFAKELEQRHRASA
ncbi:ParB/RepB/Spo0J family partition protein [Kitasatospora sp. NPDC101801]|uniref:ParB/RepB/Spo0J family partition protein n=1 Tax=Kitasatospora sp. NPDC101801 TaxID=3364103 RepID=UPI00380E360C